MAKFREGIVANCEKAFVKECLQEDMRIDERAFDEFREAKIQFGNDWGSCHVTLGDTQVLAQVTCEVQVPKSARPSEGILHVNLELNPMAAPHYEVGRPSDLSVQLNRLLEKCIKDSKAVDLESLCIKVNEKVWAFRVDVNVLNDEGNIIDAASMAALAALAHFRRPDVTCDGEEVIIHTYSQRDSIPTVIHHYPVCVSYAVFNHGQIILADPTILEEQVSEAQLTIGLNSFKEVCGFHLAGSAMMSPESILQTTQRAAVRAANVIKNIKEAIAEDTEARTQRQCIDFGSSYLLEPPVQDNTDELCMYLDVWRSSSAKKRHLRKRRQEEKDENPDEPSCSRESEEITMPAVVEQISKQSAALVPSASDKWDLHSDEEEEDDYLQPPNDVEMATPNSKKSKKKGSTSKAKMDVDSDGSEEEATIVLNADKITKKNKGKTKRK